MCIGVYTPYRGGCKWFDKGSFGDLEIVRSHGGGLSVTKRRYYFEINSSNNRALRMIRVRFDYPGANPVRTIAGAGTGGAVQKMTETAVGCDRAKVNREYGTAGTRAQLLCNGRATTASSPAGGQETKNPVRPDQNILDRKPVEEAQAGYRESRDSSTRGGAADCRSAASRGRSAQGAARAAGIAARG